MNAEELIARWIQDATEHYRKAKEAAEKLGKANFWNGINVFREQREFQYHCALGEECYLHADQLRIAMEAQNAVG